MQASESKQFKKSRPSAAQSAGREPGASGHKAVQTQLQALADASPRQMVQRHAVQRIDQSKRQAGGDQVIQCKPERYMDLSAYEGDLNAAHGVFRRFKLGLKNSAVGNFFHDKLDVGGKTSWELLIEKHKEYVNLTCDENFRFAPTSKYAKAKEILVEIEALIEDWLNSESRNGKEEKDLEKHKVVESLQDRVSEALQYVRRQVEINEAGSSPRAKSEFEQFDEAETEKRTAQHKPAMDAIKNDFKKRWEAKWTKRYANAGYNTPSDEQKAMWLENRVQQDPYCRAAITKYLTEQGVDLRTQTQIKREIESQVFNDPQLEDKSFHERRKIAEAKVQEELAARNHADLSLVIAVERSGSFLASLPGLVQKLNGPASHAEIQAALDQIKATDEAWSKQIGFHTYFIRGQAKEESALAIDQRRKVATPADRLNLSRLMADRVAIHAQLEAISGNNALPKTTVNTISNQFLPERIRRNLENPSERIAFKAWAKLISISTEEELAKKGVSLGEKAGTAVGEHGGKVGSALDAAAGKVSKLTGHAEDNSTLSIDAEAHQYDAPQVRTFLEGDGAGDILVRIGGAFSEIKALVDIISTAQQLTSSGGVVQQDWAGVGSNISSLIGKLNDLYVAVTKLVGAGAVVPIVGSATQILTSLLKGLKFFQRWSTEKQIDQEEETKPEAQQTGLLAAMQRTRKRSAKLAIYSGADCMSSALKLFAELTAATTVGAIAVGPIFGAFSLLVGAANTAYQVYESSSAASAQQEAKLSVEMGTVGSGASALAESDDFAVAGIVIEAKEALNRTPPQTEHLAVRKLVAYGIDRQQIKDSSEKVLIKAILKELDRDLNAQTLMEKIKFWKDQKTV